MAVLTVKKTGKASEAATFTPEEVPGATSEIVCPTGLELKVEANLSVVSLKTTGAAKMTLTKQLTLTGSGKSLELSAETAWSASGKLSLAGAGATTVEPVTNGVDVKLLLVQGGTTTKVKLSEKLTASTEIVLKTGILNTAGFEVSCGLFKTEGATVKELILGASVFKCTNSNAAGVPWQPGTEAFTLKAETSTIELTGKEANFEGRALAYNIVTFTGEAVAVDQSSTFASLRFNLTGSARTVRWEQGTTQTVTSLTKSAGAQKWDSSEAGKAWKLSKASALTLEEVTLKDSSGEGAGIPFKIVNGTDVSGNNTGTGWVFEAPATGGGLSMII